MFITCSNFLHCILYTTQTKVGFTPAHNVDRLLICSHADPSYVILWQLFSIFMSTVPVSSLCWWLLLLFKFSKHEALTHYRKYPHQTLLCCCVCPLAFLPYKWKIERTIFEWENIKLNYKLQYLTWHQSMTSRSHPAPCRSIGHERRGRFWLWSRRGEKRQLQWRRSSPLEDLPEYSPCVVKCVVFDYSVRKIISLIYSSFLIT